MKRLLLILFTTFSLVSIAQQNDCFTSNPFCSDQSYNFPNATGSTASNSPNYGCLGTHPNPIWYYMEIGTSGTIQINMQQTSGTNGSGTQLDVDFAMWGPFSDLTSGCNQIMSGSLAPIQCSYSTSYSETIGLGLPGGVFPGSSTPPAAVAGQVYIVILTNFSGNPGYISFNQTAGTGSADCSIVDPCVINNLTGTVSACDPNTNQYSVNGTVTVTNPPTTGNLVVTACDGTQVVAATAPFNASSYPYTINGLNSNGAACNVSVTFTDGACSQVLNYTAPNCPPGCSITAGTAVPTGCQVGNTYTVAGSISFVSPPSTGQLIVQDCSGTTQTFNAPFTSPINYSINSLTPNGQACSVTASFTADPTCTNALNYTAPSIPVVTASVDVSICSGGSTTISASGATTYSWSNGAGTGSSVSVSPTTQTTYTVTGTTNGCVGTDQVVVTVNPLPILTITPVAALCSDAAVVTLVGSPTGGTFSGAGVSGTTFNPATAGLGSNTITYNYTDVNSCSASTTTSITVSPKPTFTVASTSPTTCGGTNGTITLSGLTANTAYNVSYNNGTTTVGPISMTSNGAGNIVITGLGAGSYSNFVVTLNGCSTTVSPTITLVDPSAPTVNAGVDQTVCSGTSVTLTATNPSGAVISWSNGVTNGTAFTPAAGTVTYTVTANLSGCVATDQVVVVVNPLPTLTITPVAALCIDAAAVTVTASPTGGTLTGTGISGTTFNPATAGLGSHTITYNYTDGNTCSASTTINITVNPKPTVNAGVDQMVCSGTSVTLSATNPNGATLSWDHGVTNGIAFTPSVGTITYTVSANLLGCISTDQVDVIITPLPTVVQPPAYSCNDMSEILVTSSYSGGTWTVIDNPSTPMHEDTALVIVSGNPTNGGYVQSNTFVSAYPNHGTYTMSFTDNFCNNTQTVTLNFIAYPWTQINDTSLCIGAEQSITAATYPYTNSYEWNDGSTGPSIVVTQEGIYTVKAINECYYFIDSAFIEFKVCDIDAPNIISLSSQAGNQTWFVHSDGVTEFECLILNRWGNVINVLTDVNQHWDGSDKSGNLVSEGVYFYKIKATIVGGQEITKQGFIHVVK